jgi:thiosulfate dehydrogenase [quinone] large subunit
MKKYIVEESPFSHFFTADTRSAPLWLVVRLYIGWTWLGAGWDKLHNPAWVGDSAGAALTGFVQGALKKTGGAHPDVQTWYAYFLEHAVLPHAEAWAYLISFGEFLVGAALIVGFLVGVSAFFGVLMNYNFLLAGAVSINPIMLALGICLILAWRVAGYVGADRYVLPLLHRHIRPRFKSG